LTTWWKIEEEVSRAILDTPGVGNVNIVKYYYYVFPANSIQRLSWLFIAFSGNWTPSGQPEFNLGGRHSEIFWGRRSKAFLDHVLPPTLW
jgi:hypothetical protein